jgi:hypothetical protein
VNASNNKQNILFIHVVLLLVCLLPIISLDNSDFIVFLKYLERQEMVLRMQTGKELVQDHDYFQILLPELV